MKRLSKYSEDIITLPVSRNAAFNILKPAIERHAKIKEVSQQQDVISAKAMYGLQMTKLEFELTEINEETTIKCRGKSDDIGNGGAMKIIDKINSDLNIDGGEIRQDKKANRISTKKRVTYLVIAIVAFFAIKEIVKEPGVIYGRYDNLSSENDHIELYENSEILLHVDGPHTGALNRWGKYSVDKDENSIIVRFNDGLPEMNQALLIESNGSTWKIINGSTEYVKSEGWSQDNFKKPMYK